MNRYHNNQLSAGEKLFGQTDLDVRQSEVIKKTYLLLGLSLVAAIAGGHFASSSPTMIRFFSGWSGWIVAMIALNVIPYIAMAARHNPVLGVGALMLDGFVAGLILAPILALARAVAPDIIVTAFIITGIVFVSVTGFVMTSKRTFSAPRGLMIGIFFSLIGVMVLNMFLNIGVLGMLIAAGIGVFGVFVLVYATSDVLNNPEADSPIPGALMLFSGLFNVFVAVLHILLSLSNRD